MSKEPEVGDVWVIDKNKYCYITGVDILYVYFLSLERIIQYDFIPKDIFLTHAKYLGKSKVKIEDLFKTNNEG